MRTNLVKESIRHGGKAIGTMLFEFATNGIARIVAEAGADFIVIDMEHTGWSIETVSRLIATSRSTELVPIVRVPLTEYHFIARALDAGAMGVMVPMVETAEQAKRIVQSAKYPPRGRRGSAFSIAHDDYTGGDIVEKIASANEETLLIAQIETAEGLRNVDAIAAVEGIDVLWIGQFDLTNFLGIPGEFDHPQFLDAVKSVLAACEKNHKTAGFMAVDVTSGKSLLDQGFRILAYSGDLWVFQCALRQGITALRKHPGFSADDGI